jgi:hypothetical protein
LKKREHKKRLAAFDIKARKLLAFVNSGGHNRDGTRFGECIGNDTLTHETVTTLVYELFYQDVYERPPLEHLPELRYGLTEHDHYQRLKWYEQCRHGVKLLNTMGIDSALLPIVLE